MKNAISIITGILLWGLIGTIIIVGNIWAQNKPQDKPQDKPNNLLLTSPNVIQIQADTIILSTGQSVVKFNPERDVTCYVVNGTSISCVKFGGR